MTYAILAVMCAILGTYKMPGQRLIGLHEKFQFYTLILVATYGWRILLVLAILDELKVI